MRFTRADLDAAPEPKPEPIEPVAPPAREREWTPEQQAALDHFEGGSRRGSAVVIARAGSGKSTLALEGVRRAPERSVLLTSFSKSAVENLKPRAPSWATATSLHGVGLRLIGKRWRGADVDSKARGPALASSACPIGTPREIIRVVEAIHTKAREINPWAKNVGDLMDLADDFDLIPPNTPAEPEELSKWALKAMTLALDRTDKVDFADMIFLPIRMGWLAPAYDLVVCDELQDTTSAQSAIARGICGERFIGIGDPRQAIFAFRGADSGSLGRIQAELQAKSLSLPHTFRCGRAIVAEAKLIVPDFAAHSSVGDGLVRTAGMEQAMLEADPGEGRDQGDFFLSRTNAPLVGIALGLMKQDKRVRILGRDIAAGLLGLTQRLAKKLDDRADVWTFIDAAWDWFSREETRARESEARSAKRRVARIRDQVGMLEALAEGLATLGDLRKRISNVFADDGTGRGVTLATTHASKGLERRRTYLLRETFGKPVSCLCGHYASQHGFPGGNCRQCEKCDGYRRDFDAALEEENIRYVAITRAKEVLTWVQ